MSRKKTKVGIQLGRSWLETEFQIWMLTTSWWSAKLAGSVTCNTRVRAVGRLKVALMPQTLCAA